MNPSPHDSRPSPTALSPYYSWSPIIARQPVTWPNGARLAVCLLVALESVDWVPPTGTYVPPTLKRGDAYPSVPDVHLTSPREYGNRVGIYRVMEVMDRYAVRASAAIDAGVAEAYPHLVQESMDRGWDLIAHGTRSSRMVTEEMGEDEERRSIAESMHAIAAAAGHDPSGWMGVEYGESSRTVPLLAEANLRYVCDWPNDEQPYQMSTPEGSLVALPVMAELDDVHALHVRRWTLGSYTQMVIDAFDRLYLDAEAGGRLMVLTVHPWVMGQPFRIRYLERIVQHIVEHEGVWVTTGDEVVDSYLA